MNRGLLDMVRTGRRKRRQDTVSVDIYSGPSCTQGLERRLSQTRGHLLAVEVGVVLVRDGTAGGFDLLFLLGCERTKCMIVSLAVFVWIDAVSSTAAY